MKKRRFEYSRRARNADRLEDGQDSFLDVVSNLVGVLIILVMVAGARVRNAASEVAKVADAPETAIVDESSAAPEIQTNTIEERRAEKEDRRRRYYNDTTNTPHKRRTYLYIFKQEDLDNEDVILAVESTPTYRRTRKMQEDIHHLADGENSNDNDNNDNNGAGTNKIVF